jgi:hypothetical protein
MPKKMPKSELGGGLRDGVEKGKKKLTTSLAK